jgi:predicted ribosomally synthesized peptide with SipW-like signal peptide
MKTILKSLSIVVAVAALTSFATYAYYNASDKVSGNTFASGNLSIKADEGHCEWRSGHWGCDGTSKFDVKNAEPGTCETQKIRIKNDGNLNAREMTVSLENLVGDLCPPLKIKVNGADYSSGPINISGTIEPRHTQDISVGICFPNENTSQNQYQGKKCTFDLTVEAKAYKP